MNTTIKIWFIVTLFLCFGCSDDYLKISALKTSGIIEMRLGESVVNSKSNLSLHMVSLKDYRCPKGVICVWEGRATAAFHLKTKTNEYDFELFKYGLEDGENGEPFIAEGIKFQIVDVLPYPVEGKKQPQKVVRILVEYID